jgi:hypothetical protein
MRNISVRSRFFFYLDYETIGTAATPGLLCQPRVIMKMIVESMMECRFQTVLSNYIHLAYVENQIQFISMDLLFRSDHRTATITCDSSNKMQF